MKRRVSLSGLLAVLWITSAWAQTDTLRICSHPYSVAEAGYSYRNGNFGQVTLPASIQTYSVYSESSQMLGRVSLYGKLSYRQQLARLQNWNGMTNDYWQAVNLCDSLSGHQRSEQYQLTGAFALPLHRHWLVGAQFDYEVQQTAKESDPRNRNQWMSGTFVPGVHYRWGHFRLGASLRYASRKEQVEIRNMGAHAGYPIFAAYPLGFFKTLSQDEAPHWHYTGQEAGGALQLDIHQPAFHLFQQLSAELLQQQVESDRIQNISEGETEGWQASYRGILRHSSERARHEWSWQATLRQTSSYDPLQRQAGSGAWQSYGRVLRSTHHTAEGGLTYRYEPWKLFSLLAGLHYRQEKRTLFFYPAEFTQPIHRFTLHTMLTRSFALPRQASFDLSLGARYRKGGGTLLREKQLHEEEESPDIRLWQNTRLRQQMFDYETDPRWAIHAALTYTRQVRGSTLCWFIRLNGEYEQAPRRLHTINKKEITARTGLLF